MPLPIPPTMLCRALILSVLLFVAPLSAESSAGHPLLVGFAQDHLANDWRLAQVKELEARLAAHPQWGFIYTDAGGSTARQILDIEDMILAGVDILVTSPRDGQAMTPVIRRAHQQGIAVILLTRQIASEDYTSYISPDDTAIAREAAHFLVSKLSGKGRVVMLEGVPTASTTQQRSEAFLEVLARHPQLELVATRVGNYLRNDAIRAMEEVLAEGIEFDAIYAHSDSMASGARMALKQAGIDPASRVIVGIDYIAEAREAILAGEQTASFTYPTCVSEAVEVILQIAQGAKPPRLITVPSQRVDSTNVRLIEPIF